MSSSNTPGLQISSRRVVSRSTRRPMRPSGPGVRWRLSPSVAVRFNADMTRVHLDEKGHRNLIQIRYRTSMRDRPSDVVLAMLLKPFITPSMNRSVGNRSWILQQDGDGWRLALDVRNGRGCCFTVPVAHQEQPLGDTLDLGNPRKIAETVRTLWHRADLRIANPDQYLEEVFADLRR